MAVFMAAERFVVTRLARAPTIAVWMRTVDADVAAAHQWRVILVNQRWDGCIPDHVRLHFVQWPFSDLLDGRCSRMFKAVYRALFVGAAGQ